VPDRMWLDDTPYIWLQRNLKTLGVTLLISAGYDVGLSVFNLLFPSWMGTWLGIPMPEGLFYLYLWSLAHLVFAWFCVLGWLDVKRNILIAAGALVARVGYALFMFLCVWRLHIRATWAIFGGISLAFAVAHYVLLRLSDFGLWQILVRAGNPPGMRRK
jgi:hypothetical protein